MKKNILILGIVMMLLMVASVMGAECDGTFSNMPCEVSSGVIIMNDNLTNINVTLNGGSFYINGEVTGDVYMNSSSGSFYFGSTGTNEINTEIISDLNIHILVEDSTIELSSYRPTGFTIINPNNYNVRLSSNANYEVGKEAGIKWFDQITGVDSYISGEISGAIEISSNNTIIIYDNGNPFFTSSTIKEYGFAGSGIDANNYGFYKDGNLLTNGVDYTESYVSGDYIYLIVNGSSIGNWTIMEVSSNTAPTLSSTVAVGGDFIILDNEVEAFHTYFNDEEGDATFTANVDGTPITPIYGPNTYFGTYFFEVDGSTLSIGNHTLESVIDDGEYSDSLSVTIQVIASNTAPVINSISPDTRLELKNGESQIYTSDVTDTEGDASYSWTLDGTEVATTESYTADWDNIEAGIYTLQLEVSDAEYSDTESTILEIRAVGGSASTPAVTTTTSSSNSITGNVVTTTTDSEQNVESVGLTRFQDIWQRFINWLRGLF